jgi:Zn-dependent peptidase ImmA (M78 family)
MIPDTKNGLPAMACVSAMQKSIRRGLEREAMEFAVELLHTSKAFHSMVCNRLEVICHEDLDTLAAPWVVPFVATALAQSRGPLQQLHRRSPAHGRQLHQDHV